MLKDYCRRCALHCETASDHWLCLGVNPSQANTGFQLNRGLLICRRHHLTIATRGGPKFNDDRNFIQGNGAFKIGRVKIDGAGNEQFLLASSAFGPFVQSRALYPVGRITMRTNNLQEFFHDSLPRKGFIRSGVPKEICDESYLLFNNEALSVKEEAELAHPQFFIGGGQGGRAPTNVLEKS